MEKYTIEIKETLSRIMEVEAPSKEEAFEKLKTLYDAEEIVLDANDFVDVDYIDVNCQKDNDKQIFDRKS
jgi:hypothetical protein